MRQAAMSERLDAFQKATAVERQAAAAQYKEAVQRQVIDCMERAEEDRLDAMCGMDGATNHPQTVMIVSLCTMSLLQYVFFGGEFF
jgi:hypothetical protein